MHKELIIAAFEKAKKELNAKGGIDPSTHQASIVISNYLGEDFGFRFGERRLSDYYREAVKLDLENNVNISQIKVVEGICQYLGYSNYEKFITDTVEKEKRIVYEGKNKNEKQTSS